MIISFPYILFGEYICILALEIASPGKQHCVNCIGTLSFPMSKLLFTLTGLGYASLNEPDTLSRCNHRRRKGSVVGRHHGECGARAYNGGLGAEPPAGSRGRAPGQGGEAPLKLKAFLVIGCPTEPANLAPVRENSMFCYGPLVSQLGGPRVHSAPPTPSLGGPVPPRLRCACL